MEKYAQPGKHPDVRYGPINKDGDRAVHFRIHKDVWKHVGWLMGDKG